MAAVLENTITLDPDKEYEIVNGVPKWLWQLSSGITVVVIAPDDTYGKVINQLSDYLNAGADQVWLMSPEDKMIIVHYSMTKFKIFRENDLFTCEELLPGFRCKVGDLFMLPKLRP